MSRYLIRSFVDSAIGRGQRVECFLGSSISPEGRAVRWVELSSEGAEAVLRLYEKLDLGDESHVDVYSFPETNGLEQGEALAEHRFESLDEAISDANSRYGADAERYVNAGVVQDEYLDLVRDRSGAA